MLDKTSRKVLRFITKIEPNMNDGLFTYDYVGQKCGLKSRPEIMECIRFLDAKGLLNCIYVEIPGSNGKKALHGFLPSHKGRHYAEFARLEFCKSIFESVLLPILVSIITALLVAA